MVQPEMLVADWTRIPNSCPWSARTPPPGHPATQMCHTTGPAVSPEPHCPTSAPHYFLHKYHTRMPSTDTLLKLSTVASHYVPRKYKTLPGKSTAPHHSNGQSCTTIMSSRHPHWTTRIVTPPSPPPPSYPEASTSGLFFKLAAPIPMKRVAKFASVNRSPIWLVRSRLRHAIALNKQSGKRLIPTSEQSFSQDLCFSKLLHSSNEI